jgi:hypothetical protein
LGATFKDEAFSDDDDFSDSKDSFASNDEATKTGKDGDEIRVRLYSRVIQFFLNKILDIYEKNVTREDVSSYVSSQECLSVAFLLGILSRIGLILDKLGCSSGRTP